MKKKHSDRRDYIPTLYFDTMMEFDTAYAEYEHIIHYRMYDGIKDILDGLVNDRDYIILAYLNEDNFCFGSPREVWLDNLEGSLTYFEEIENYKMCSKVVKLVNRLKEEQDE